MTTSVSSKMSSGDTTDELTLHSNDGLKIMELESKIFLMMADLEKSQVALEMKNKEAAGAEREKLRLQGMNTKLFQQLIEQETALVISEMQCEAREKTALSSRSITREEKQTAAEELLAVRSELKTVQGVLEHKTTEAALLMVRVQ